MQTPARVDRQQQRGGVVVGRDMPYVEIGISLAWYCQMVAHTNSYGSASSRAPCPGCDRTRNPRPSRRAT